MIEVNDIDKNVKCLISSGCSVVRERIIGTYVLAFGLRTDITRYFVYVTTNNGKWR